MELPISWVEGGIVTVIALGTYIYTQDKRGAQAKMDEFAATLQRNSETMSNATITIALQQQQIAYMKEQFDEMFTMLREIRDKLEHKQDKVH